MTKRTFGGTKLKKVRKIGFRARMKSHGGQQVLKRRRQKNRRNLIN